MRQTLNRLIHLTRLVLALAVLGAGAARTLEPDSQSWDKITEEIVGIGGGAALLLRNQHD
jgi:hypothetical protein